MMLKYALMYITALNYPDSKEIDDYLIQQNIPADLSKLSLFQRSYWRIKYPYAYLRKDVPKDWLENNDLRYEIDSYKYKSIQQATQDLNDAMRKKNYDFLGGVENRKFITNQYYQYMEYLNGAKPYPVPIILFRGIKINKPQVGDEHIELGFNSKSYFYHLAKKYQTTCCMLIMSYPAGHIFVAPPVKRFLWEYVSYPGEVFKITKVQYDNVYCEFLRYEPHIDPSGKKIII